MGRAGQLEHETPLRGVVNEEVWICTRWRIKCDYAVRFLTVTDIGKQFVRLKRKVIDTSGWECQITQKQHTHRVGHDHTCTHDPTYTHTHDPTYIHTHDTHLPRVL